MAEDAAISDIARLFQRLEEEKVRYLIAGMSAAVLQGVPYTTLGLDIWIDLPSRQYMRVINWCRFLRAEMVANTVVIPQDGTTVNFLYRVDGLNSFPREYRFAVTVKWVGRSVKALPVDRILKSKESINRPKDVAHLPILRTFLKCREC